MDVIKNLQGEVEDRNKKILKLELNQKAKIVTQHDRPHSPRIEMTSLVTPAKMSGTTAGTVCPKQIINKQWIISNYIVSSNY